MKLGLFGMPLHPVLRPISEVYDEDQGRIILADQLGFRRCSSASTSRARPSRSPAR